MSAGQLLNTFEDIKTFLDSLVSGEYLLKSETNYSAPQSRNQLLTSAELTKLVDLPVITQAQVDNFVAAYDRGDWNAAIVTDLVTDDDTKLASASAVYNLKGMIDNINSLIASDDTTLDELQEIVDFIKNNKDTLDNLGIANITGLQAALDAKVDKVTGKGLSTNDLTDDLLNKLNTVYDSAIGNEAFARLDGSNMPFTSNVFIRTGSGNFFGLFADSNVSSIPNAGLQLTGSGAGYLVLRDSSLGNRIYFDASGVSYINRPLAIGGTDPGIYQLHVDGTANVSGEATFRSSLTKFYGTGGASDRRLTLNVTTSGLAQLYNYDETDTTFHDIEIGGTSTPGTGMLVQPNGDVQISGTDSIINLISSTSGNYITFTGSGGINGYIGSADLLGLGGSADSLALSSTGNQVLLATSGAARLTLTDLMSTFDTELTVNDTLWSRGAIKYKPVAGNQAGQITLSDTSYYSYIELKDNGGNVQLLLDSNNGIYTYEPSSVGGTNYWRTGVNSDSQYTLHRNTVEKARFGDTQITFFTKTVVEDTFEAIGTITASGGVFGGDVSVSGTITADGSGLTNLDASNILNGTLADSRLSANVSLLNVGNVYSSPNFYFAADTVEGADTKALGIFGGGIGGSSRGGFVSVFGNENAFYPGQVRLSAGDIGHVDIHGDTMLGGFLRVDGDSTDKTYTAAGILALKKADNNPLISFHGDDGSRQGYIQNGAGKFIISAEGLDLIELLNNVDITGNLDFTGVATGNGNGLISLNASNISSGTLDDARLSANIALLDAENSFSGRILVPSGSASLPGLGMGDGDTGIYELADDVLGFTVGGNSRFYINSSGFNSSVGAAGAFINRLAASGTVPVYSFLGDTGLGIGKSSSGVMSFIAGSVERMTVSGSGVIAYGSLTVDGGSSSILRLKDSNGADFRIGSGDIANLKFGIYDETNSQTIALFSNSVGVELQKNTRITGTLLTSSLSGTGNRIAQVSSTGLLSASISVSNIPLLDATNTFSAEQTFDGGIKLNNDDRVAFGDDSDLEIFHDSTPNNNKIKSNLAGGLYLISTVSGGDISLMGTGSSLLYTAIRASSDGTNVYSELLYNSVVKASSTSSGLEITGDLTVSGTISGDGSGLTNLDAGNITSGTLADGSLSSNVALRDVANSFADQIVLTNSINASAPLELQRSSQVGIFFNDTSSPGYLGISSGELYFGGLANHSLNNKVFHEGNFGKVEVDALGINAATLSGFSASSLLVSNQSGERTISSFTVDLDTALTTFGYAGSSSSNRPFDTNGHFISWSLNSNFTFQLYATAGSNDNVYVRKQDNGTWEPWKALLDEFNYSSFLNSDNWDTAHGWGDHAAAGYATQAWVESQGFLTSFSEADTLDTVVGRGSTTSNNIDIGGLTVNHGSPTLDFNETSSTGQWRMRVISEEVRFQFDQIDDGNYTAKLYITSDETIVHNSLVAKGLISADAGLNVTGNIEADLLDLPDNGHARFGASDDLLIFHSGTDSFVRNQGTGNLYLETRNSGGDLYLRVEDTGGTSHDILRAFGSANPYVALYYDGSNKLQTDSAGIKVTGQIDTGQGFTDVYRQDQNLRTSDDVEFQAVSVGTGSGSVALTINDGYGNANLTFNHKDGTPDQDGVAARIEVNTDATDGTAGTAKMYFELGDNVSNGVATSLSNVLTLSTQGSSFGTDLNTSGDISWTGTASGNGSGITSLNASNISTGTLNTDVLPADVVRYDTTPYSGTGSSITAGGMSVNRIGFESLSNDDLGGGMPDKYTGSVVFKLDGDGRNFAFVKQTDTEDFWLGLADVSGNLIFRKVIHEGNVSSYASVYSEGTGIDISGTTIAVDSNVLLKNTDGTIAAHHQYQDGYEVRFGNSADMHMFHTGTHGYLDLVSGNYIIRDGTTTRFTFSRTNGQFQATGHILSENYVYSGGGRFVFGLTTGEGEYISRSGDTLEFYSGGSNRLEVGSSVQVNTNMILADGHNIQVGIGEGITFYGNNDTGHSIQSRDSGGNPSDDIRINSLGSVIVNLDSNNNNTTSADFVIGRHGSNGALADILFNLNGESGALTIDGTLAAGADVTWDSNQSGNPRAVGIGYSGSDYGGISHGVTYTGTSNTHQYAINDVVTRVDLHDGLVVYAAPTGTIGSTITWEEVLEVQRDAFDYKGQSVLHAGNYTSYLTNTLKLLNTASQASLDSLTDNGYRILSYSGYSSALLSFNAGGSTGTVQQEYLYNTPVRGYRIRNKTDNSTWSDWGYVVMTTSNQGHISGTVWHSANDGDGSGLDADLLDGVQGSSYARTDINETFSGTVTATNFIDYSDSRLKQELEQPVPGLELIRKLEPKIYLKEGMTESGFYADQLPQEAEYMRHKIGGDYWGMDYKNLHAVEVTALKELACEVERLEEENTVLKARLTLLEDRFEQLLDRI